MKKLLLFLFVIGAFGFLSSCSDDPVPVVNITSPADGAVFLQIDSLEVIASVTHDMDITSITTLVEPGAIEGSLDIDQLTDKQDFTFSTAIALSVGAGNYTLTLTASDLAGNSGTDSVEFEIQ